MPETPNMPARPPGSRGRGRPPLISYELIDEFARHVRAGNYLDTVGWFLGVDRVTLGNWMRRGNKEHRRIQTAVQREQELRAELETVQRRNKRERLEREIAECVAAQEPLASERIYLDFLISAKEARAAAEMADLGIIGRAAMGTAEVTERITQPDGTIIERKTAGQPAQWAAAAWRRERMQPHKFGKRDAHKLEHTGRGGGPIQHNVQQDVVFYVPDNGRGDADTSDGEPST